MFNPIRADWPAPANVHALTTTRQGGVSAAPFASLNVGDHVADDPAHVALNRSKIIQQCDLPSEPLWLKQVHGIDVVDASGATSCSADGSFCSKPNTVLAIMTADCLPVLFCSRQGDWIGACHAGWRGLCDGVIEQTVKHYPGAKSDVLVWLGPAIGPQAFEVGDEVRAAFIAQNREAEYAFVRNTSERWLADLFLLARQRLTALGITAIYGGGLCTYTDREQFYSYRRDKETGRMASLIWMT